MRCMVCGAEMRVMQVVPDDTMAVPGYERHTLQCSDCGDVETRLMFSREKTPVDNAPIPQMTPVAPRESGREHLAPASDPEREPVVAETKPERARAAAPSAWARAVALFRGRSPDTGS
jgi:hypothetical protein